MARSTTQTHKLLQLLFTLSIFALLFNSCSNDTSVNTETEVSAEPVVQTQDTIPIEPDVSSDPSTSETSSAQQGPAPDIKVFYNGEWHTTPGLGGSGFPGSAPLPQKAPAPAVAQPARVAPVAAQPDTSKY